MLPARRNAAARRRFAAAFPFERLETRALMTASPADPAAFLKHGSFAKGGQALFDLVAAGPVGAAITAAQTPAETSAAAARALYDVNAAGVLLDVSIAGPFADSLRSIAGFGGQIIAQSEQLRAASVRVPLDRAEAFVALPVIAAARVASRPQSHAAVAAAPSGPTTSAAGPQPGNQVANQADRILKTDVVRRTYGIDGSGITIGVLSDSVSRVGNGLTDSQQIGELPDSVNVLQDGPEGDSTDEGRAMLELIHDIAPGASLAFATAFEGGQLGFAENIGRLFNEAGARVIVDDVSYFDEPVFQPGVIDGAINRVVNGGGLYFSSAGNSGGRTGYLFTSPAFTNGKQELDFKAGPQVDTRLRITVPKLDGLLGAFGVGLIGLNVQWNDQYTGLPSPDAIRADLDLAVYTTKGELVTRGIDDNFATGTPIEKIMWLPPGQYDVVITLAAGTAPTAIRLGCFDGSFTAEFADGTAAAYGHNAGPWTMSVGAVPFSGAPPFSTKPIRSEPYSSFGQPWLTGDKDGNPLSTPYRPLSPFISAPDGSNTSFFGGLLADSPDDPDLYPNFYGTSAAAPNLAAGAALMLQRFPQATQAEIALALAQTARPINGTATQRYDVQGGFGLADVSAAIVALGSTQGLGAVIDDGAAGFTAAGSWTMASKGGYVRDHRTTSSRAGTAEWTFSGLADGTYQVQVTWVAAKNRSQLATYTLLDGGTVAGSFQRSQRVAPSGALANGAAWETLGTISVVNGQCRVRLTNGSGRGTISADAVRLTPTTSTPAGSPTTTGMMAAAWAALAATPETPITRRRR
ncbi:MAG: S8 family serine peptidase [Pirellulales bacterium]